MTLKDLVMLSDFDDVKIQDKKAEIRSSIDELKMR